MTFVVAQRVHGVGGRRGRSMLRAGRLLVNKWCAMRIPNYDERPYLYLSRMPVAVVSSRPAALTPPGPDGHR